MAGICGIFLKNKESIQKSTCESALAAMLNKLVYKDTQRQASFQDKRVFIGNAVPTSSLKNDHYVKIPKFPFHFFLDGLVFINDNEKQLLAENFKIKELDNDYQYLPYLYEYYKNDFSVHLTGWFNIFIYNEITNESILVNDRLGFLPLYYYDKADYFLFSSRIESLLDSGLIKNIKLDETTIAEHLLFNYPLSDHTYIQEINTLSHATQISFKGAEVNLKQYWDIKELFNLPALNTKESIGAINRGLEDSLTRLLNSTNQKINFSLTGGWDSRVVLSYLLPENKHKLNTFSFGAPGVDDITIPQHISGQENFDYTPYPLDQEYLDKRFIPNAKDTIMLSNGTRNYKRTHYLYAAKQISETSDILLTGIFGDEVFKVGKPQPGTVITENAIKFIESGFNEDIMIYRFSNSKIPEILNAPEKEISEKLKSRLSSIKNKFLKYDTKSQQYFAFRLTLNLRKYFGNEANSYNDFVYCFSPFIDYDFLKAFARSKFMVTRYKFQKPSLKLKFQSSRLYYKLIHLNYPELNKYPSGRGFSMKDTGTITGIPKVIFNKFLKKKGKTSIDGFNTKLTDSIFYNSVLKNNTPEHSDILKTINESRNLNKKEDYNSLFYWISTIQSNYKNRGPLL